MKKTVNEIRKNYEFRSFMFAFVSFAVTGAFLFLNFYLGVFYQSVWNFSISFYYLTLTALRGLILFSEWKWKQENIKGRNSRRIRLFRCVTSVLLLMDIVLIVPISLMVLSQRSVSITMIPAIAIAAYTTYKIILAVVNFKRASRQENLSLYGLRILNLKDAIASVLTLQNTMVMVFGEGKSMQTLTAYTSAVILVGMIALTFSFIREGREKETVESLPDCESPTKECPP